MRVRAKSAGFHGGARRRPGDVFNMDPAKFKQKDGKPVMPSWVEEVVEPAPTPKAEAKGKPGAQSKAGPAGADLT